MRNKLNITKIYTFPPHNSKTINLMEEYNEQNKKRRIAWWNY